MRWFLCSGSLTFIGRPRCGKAHVQCRVLRSVRKPAAAVVASHAQDQRGAAGEGMRLGQGEVPDLMMFSWFSIMNLSRILSSLRRCAKLDLRQICMAKRGRPPRGVLVAHASRVVMGNRFRSVLCMCCVLLDHAANRMMFLCVCFVNGFIPPHSATLIVSTHTGAFSQRTVH